VTRRRAIRLSLVVPLLLLGAATTVGVAWGLVWLDPAQGHATLVQDQSFTVSGWPISVPSDWPPPNAAYRINKQYSQREETIVFSDPDPSGTQNVLNEVIEQRIGWPLCGLGLEAEGFQWEQAVPLGASFPSWRARPIRASFPWSPDWCDQFPCLPIWPGFAIDTTLYAAVWWVLLFTPLPLYRTARRRLRVSRGMCGSCGYNLKGSPTGACPECGSATAWSR
jgi:hypothetical protein